MKKFLLQTPTNQAWVVSQEALHSNQLQSKELEREIRLKLYPELQMQPIRTAQQFSCENGMMTIARQRLLFKDVLRELLTVVNRDVIEDNSKKTAQRKVVLSWYKKFQGFFLLSSRPWERKY